MPSPGSVVDKRAKFPPACPMFSQPASAIANENPGTRTCVWYLPGESSPRHVWSGSQVPSTVRLTGRGIAVGMGFAVGVGRVVAAASDRDAIAAAEVVGAGGADATADGMVDDVLVAHAPTMSATTNASAPSPLDMDRTLPTAPGPPDPRRDEAL